MNKDLQQFTVDARIGGGGDIYQNNRFVKQAQERVKRSALAFIACASGFWFLIF